VKLGTSYRSPVALVLHNSQVHIDILDYIMVMRLAD